MLARLNLGENETYRSVMDSDANAFSRLPKTVRFQYMSILSFMWSGVFALWIGNMVLFGPSVIGHLILLIGVFFTANAFRKARSHTTQEIKHHS
jgi:hypothetical protein